MAHKPSTIESARDIDDRPEASQEVRHIEELIAQCNRQMDSIGGSLSEATRSQTKAMYQEFLREARSSPDVRAERLAWMQQAADSMERLLVRAPTERARFESDLAKAVEKHWISAADVPKWMAEFDNPELLEMYRSQWLKETWEKKYKEGWKKLAQDRQRVIDKAKAAGVTAKQLPELDIVERHDLFLAKERNFHARQSLVKAVDAKIDAVAGNTLGALRRHETFLHAASAGKNRCLHPAKVGAWLQKIQSDPTRYTPDVMQGYADDWRAARMRYDDLSKRSVDEGRPDGCAPLNLNAFLELSYETRLATLNEWHNRLDAAKRLRDLDRTDALEDAKLAIRRSIDLKDYDAAERDLAELRTDHPYDADARSIAAHLETLRSREERTDETSEEERTTQAIESLQTVRQGVPAAVAAHYEHLLESGDPDKAATFFRAMKLRGERRLQGETTDEDERDISETAELVDRTVVLDGNDDDDTTHVLVTEGTSPAVTMLLLSQQQNRRSPALVIEGVSFEQQQQLVRINERVLANMRHLESVGKRRADDTEAVAA